MKYVLFLGCKIPTQLPAYEASTRAVMAHLGVTLVDLEFNCCGYPARDVSRDAFVVSAARNLALAERAGLDVLTPCTCCQGALRHAIPFLNEDEELRARVTLGLSEEALGAQRELACVSDCHAGCQGNPAGRIRASRLFSVSITPRRRNETASTDRRGRFDAGCQPGVRFSLSQGHEGH
jgi:Fe-S oxidoreductase